MIPKLFTILFLFCLSLPGETMPEKSISLFDFENRSGDPALNYLETRLPALLMDQRLRLPEYHFTLDKSLPDSRDQVVSRQIPQINFAILGKFSFEVLENRLLITLEVINTSTYRSLGTGSCAISLGELSSGGESLIHCLANILKLKPLPADILAKTPKINQIDIDESTMQAVRDEIQELSGQFDKAQSEMDSLRKMSGDRGHFQNVYYRKLHNTEASTDLGLALDNRSVVENALYSVLSNPYVADIGEAQIHSYPYNPGLLTVRFEIEYRLKKEIIEDIIELVPFKSVRNVKQSYDFHTYTAKFSDIPFQLRRDIQRGDYRIIAIVKLVDRHSRPRYIILDEKYLTEELPDKRSLSMAQTNQFIQLMVMTASNIDIQIYLNNEPHVSRYELEMNVKDFNDLDHIAVEFIRLADLPRYLKEIH
jgi:hypothetical protein